MTSDYVAYMAAQSFLYVQKLEEQFMTALEQVQRLATAYVALQAELTAALANDVADKDTIQAQQIRLSELQTINTELQALKDADIAEDGQIGALVDSLLPPVVTPPVDPAPVVDAPSLTIDG